MVDTIITNTPNRGDDSGSSGWIVALVVMAVVIIGGIVLYQKGFFETAAPGTTNINVTVPDPTPVTPVTPTN